MTTRAERTDIALTHFRAGVTATLRTWAALKAAVDGEWGGIESHSKAEDLRSNILERYDGTKAEPMPLEELEENLLEYMEDEYSILLEDESERLIASLIYKMYEECSVGNAQLVEKMVKDAAKLNNIPKQKVVLTTDGEMESDDDSDLEDEADGDEVSGNDDAMDEVEETAFQFNLETARLFSEGPLFEGGRKTISQPVNLPPPRQLGEAAPEVSKVDLDEDGFASVAPRRKKGIK